MTSISHNYYLQRKSGHESSVVKTELRFTELTLRGNIFQSHGHRESPTSNVGINSIKNKKQRVNLLCMPETG